MCIIKEHICDSFFIRLFSDVYSCQHTRDATKLPRRPHHVLTTQSLRKLQQQQQSQHGHLAPSTSGQLGHDPTRAQPAGLMDSGAFPATGPPAPRLALGCQPASGNRTEGQRRHGGREMRAWTTRPTGGERGSGHWFFSLTHQTWRGTERNKE